MELDFDIKLVIQLLEERITSLDMRTKEVERFQEITHRQYQKVIQHSDPNENIDIQIQVHEIQQNIECLFTCMKGLETKFGMINSFKPLKPHKCPICNGTGEREWYENGGLHRRVQRCVSCEAKGIVWG